VILSATRPRVNNPVKPPPDAYVAPTPEGRRVQALLYRLAELLGGTKAGGRT
jgi:hypothetical protein